MSKQRDSMEKVGKFFEVKPKDQLVEVRNALASAMVTSKLTTTTRAWEIINLEKAQRETAILSFGKQASDKLLPMVRRLAALE